MNNNITEDYCSFEICKLLKEKGFSVYCTLLYTEEGKQNDVGNYNGVDDDNYISYSRPTHSLAIKWIRENFGFNIYSRNFSDLKFRSYIVDANGDMEHAMTETPFNSPEEATEAALLYTLQNLIP